MAETYIPVPILAKGLHLLFKSPPVMGVSINTLHSKALMYFLRMILPPRNNIKTIPVSLAAEGITQWPLEPVGAKELGERPEQKGVVHELNPSGSFSPRDNTAGSFTMASSSQVPVAQRIAGRQRQSIFGSPFSKILS